MNDALKKREEKFIIERGNGLFNTLLFVFVLITIAGCMFFQKLEMEECRQYLLYINIFSLMVMIPYRIYLVFDKEYMDSVYPNVRRAYLFELPFFPCNTAEILFTIAILLQSRVLMGYCFFLGLIGPIVAFTNQPLGFEKESLFKLRILGFYSTHYLCLINIPLMLVSGVYVPVYSDIPKVLTLYLLFSFVMYLFNLYLNTLDLGYPANYFFTMDPDYHPVFRKCYDIIPHLYVFTIPIVLFFGILLLVAVFFIHLFI